MNVNFHGLRLCCSFAYAAISVRRIQKLFTDIFRKEISEISVNRKLQSISIVNSYEYIWNKHYFSKLPLINFLHEFTDNTFSSEKRTTRSTQNEHHTQMQRNVFNHLQFKKRHTNVFSWKRNRSPRQATTIGEFTSTTLTHTRPNTHTRTSNMRSRIRAVYVAGTLLQNTIWLIYEFPARNDGATRHFHFRHTRQKAKGEGKGARGGAGRRRGRRLSRRRTFPIVSVFD